MKIGPVRPGPLRRDDLHGDFHTVKSVWFSFPSAGERGRFFVLAGHGDSHMLEAGAFVVRGIEAAPALAGHVDLRPGVRGAVLAFTHSDVAGDKSRSETPMSRGFHHEDRVVAAGSGAQSERPAGELDAGFLAANVLEGFIDMRVQLVQEFGGVNQLAWPVKVQQPLLQGRAVMRIAGKAVLDDLHLLVCIVLERIGIGAGVDEAFDGFIIVKVDIHLTQETQFPPGLGESEDDDGIPIDVAQPSHVGFGLDLKTRTRDMEIVPLARP